MGSYSLPSFSFASPPGNSEWILTSKILDRDAFGNPKEVEDAYGNQTSYTWEHNDALLVSVVWVNWMWVESA